MADRVRINRFLGDKKALRYAQRDLATLHRASRLCENKRSVVQAGGCLGVFAEALADEFKNVYTFEPDSVNFRRMVHNLTGYGRENVFMFQAALGMEHGGVQTSRTRRTKVDLPPHDGVVHVSGSGPIPRLCVDDLLLQDLDLLVLDLEGYELWALLGAKDTVERCRPVIMVEINDNCTFEGIEPEDVRTRLRIMGYDFRFREFSDEVWTWGR